MTEEEKAELKRLAERFASELNLPPDEPVEPDEYELGDLVDGVLSLLAENEALRARVAELEDRDIECLSYMSCDEQSDEPEDHSPHCPMSNR